MKIKITRSFRDRLNDQVGYIAKDKPEAARNFKEEIIRTIRNIPLMPYKQRKLETVARVISNNCHPLAI